MNKTFTLLFLLIATHIVQAQNVTIYSQNFGDANNLVFPAGWTSTDNGWYVDNTNVSQGYDNASGQANMAIKNTSPTGEYILTTGGIETSGYENIKVLWGRRISNNYTTFSTLPIFEFSVDNGATWNVVEFYDAFENNSWALANAGDDIMIPSVADDKPSVRFRWRVSITNNPEGTYRIDDFRVQGTVKQTNVGINTPQLHTVRVWQNQSQLNISLESLNAPAQFCLFDLQGSLVQSSTLTNTYNRVSLEALPAGMYIYSITGADIHTGGKVVIAH